MRNNTGGKKFKSGKKGGNSGQKTFTTRDESEVYGIVERNLGGSHYCVRILNVDDPGSSETMMCTLRGSMRRRKSTNFVGKDSIVLVSLREYEDGKGDILCVYTQNQVVTLMRQGEIPMLQDYSLAMQDDDTEDQSVVDHRRSSTYADIYDELEEKTDTNKDKIDLNDI